MLCAYLPALEAERQLDRVRAASAPHYKADDQRGMIRALQAQARALYPQAEPDPPTEPIVHDPEQATAWFEAQGIRTV
jgi:hypothetical protein